MQSTSIKKTLKRLTLAACATSLLFAYAGAASAQSVDQLQQLRERAQQSQSSGIANQSLSPLSISTQRTLPGASSSANTMGQFSTQPRNGVNLPGEPTIDTVFPAQMPMENPPFAANLFIGGFESERSTGLNAQV